MCLGQQPLGGEPGRHLDISPAVWHLDGPDWHPSTVTDRRGFLDDATLDRPSQLLVSSAAVLSAWHRFLVTTTAPTSTITYRSLSTAMEQLQEARRSEDFDMLEQAWRAVTATRAQSTTRTSPQPCWKPSTTAQHDPLAPLTSPGPRVAVLDVVPAAGGQPRQGLILPPSI